jgi:predicted dehydrogenase
MRPGDPDWGRENPDAWGLLVTDDGERTVETEAGAYERFYGGVVEALRSSGEPPVDPLDSVQVLRIIETAFDSARRGSVVPFEGSPL